MPRRLIFFILILSMVPFIYAEDVEPVPYEPDEFPEWLIDVRRAEIIMIGSIPISIISANMIYSLYKWGENDFSSDYAPGIFGTQSAKSMDNDEKLGVLTVTLSISAIIALTDFILNKVGSGKK